MPTSASAPRKQPLEDPFDRPVNHDPIDVEQLHDMVDRLYDPSLIQQRRAVAEQKEAKAKQQARYDATYDNHLANFWQRQRKLQITRDQSRAEWLSQAQESLLRASSAGSPGDELFPPSPNKSEAKNDDDSSYSSDGDDEIKPANSSKRQDSSSVPDPEEDAHQQRPSTVPSPASTPTSIRLSAQNSSQRRQHRNNKQRVTSGPLDHREVHALFMIGNIGTSELASKVRALGLHDRINLEWVASTENSFSKVKGSTLAVMPEILTTLVDIPEALDESDSSSAAVSSAAVPPKAITDQPSEGEKDKDNTDWTAAKSDLEMSSLFAQDVLRSVILAPAADDSAGKPKSDPKSQKRCQTPAMSTSGGKFSQKFVWATPQFTITSPRSVAVLLRNGASVNDLLPVRYSQFAGKGFRAGLSSVVIKARWQMEENQRKEMVRELQRQYRDLCACEPLPGLLEKLRNVQQPTIAAFFGPDELAQRQRHLSSQHKHVHRKANSAIRKLVPVQTNLGLQEETTRHNEANGSDRLNKDDVEWTTNPNQTATPSNRALTPAAAGPGSPAHPQHQRSTSPQSMVEHEAAMEVEIMRRHHRNQERMERYFRHIMDLSQKRAEFCVEMAETEHQKAELLRLQREREAKERKEKQEEFERHVAEVQAQAVQRAIQKKERREEASTFDSLRAERTIRHNRVRRLAALEEQTTVSRHRMNVVKQRERQIEFEKLQTLEKIEQRETMVKLQQQRMQALRHRQHEEREALRKALEKKNWENNKKLTEFEREHYRKLDEQQRERRSQSALR